ncbi:MAG: NADH-quinone oxidoreductase subunit J [Nitrososphaerota archaeon]|jgi:NADH:ubiquinone oxidoreductase subunit 6 (subunit J)|uniref:NADH-quinone oxidoreductase subunit J n=1 Tax=Candidatus Bathycorpusculum sp. TaxID=2994959 RepID=UPI0028355E59|nr:NADH-quinone oxidoreductase subunit J [Candidatus Termitimicrobium sp.]MCL2432545.1 NADH-quinone oxidoreductase subunit J [Candidatus Termitimicrobium sp.]MDR0492562.1 NADH-quinone oxidoreductase subunit J [Nitrososphaerota archaeon]
MIFEILAIGLIVSSILALFLDEVVYSVAALSGTFLFTALLYYLNGAVYAAIFQFVVGIGTLAALFLSGEMLGEKSPKKASPAKTSGLIGAGILLSLPAIFLSVSDQTTIGPDIQIGEALWSLRGLDVLLQAIVILTTALGIGIVLYERRKK